MPFKIKAENQGRLSSRIVLNERVWLTRDGDLVKDGDPRAASLYCAPGHSVLREEFERLSKIKPPSGKPISRKESFGKGRPKNDEPSEDEPEPKGKKPPANKAKDPGENKGA